MLERAKRAVEAAIEQDAPRHPISQTPLTTASVKLYMLLYKFYKPDNLSFTMLRHGEIYFASPPELNDSDESRVNWVLSGDSDMWVSFSEYILCLGAEKSGRDHLSEEVLKSAVRFGQIFEEVASSEDLPIERLASVFASTANQLGYPTKDHAEKCERFVESEIIKKIEEVRFTASFCKTAKNSLMWAYYADADKGFSLILDTENQMLSLEHDLKIFHDKRPLPGKKSAVEFGRYETCDVDLRDVIYRNSAVIGNVLNELLCQFYYTDEDYPVLWSADTQQDEKHLVGLVKSDIWRHEAEVRAFFPNRKFGGGSAQVPKDLRSVKVAGKHIRGVIFGFRMKAEDEERALWALCALRKQLQITSTEASKVIDFYVFKASKVPSTLDLKISPMGILGEPCQMPDNGFRKIKNLNPRDIEILNDMALKINSSAPGSWTAPDNTFAVTHPHS